MSGFSNAMRRQVAQLSKVPQFLRPTLRNFALGRAVPFTGTAGLNYEVLTENEVKVSVKNRRPVQNHIKGVHACAMALMAETASGFVVGMNIPDDKLPLLKQMTIQYKRRTEGNMQAVATLTPEQIDLIRNTDKGEVVVPTEVTDETDVPPIQVEMVWAWVPKNRKPRKPSA
eukprot:TRINITY_DN113912_c0_g1_i1.p1 TRINITY_DN113912_c0_g1~~TRINITY_DN113912_c0_g1_i1.p1  ORF type:complete len:172 (+),score=13.99 TRINITY_DN113912_c0_g1_i1:48-563(+)